MGDELLKTSMYLAGQTSDDKAVSEILSTAHALKKSYTEQVREIKQDVGFSSYLLKVIKDSGLQLDDDIESIIMEEPISGGEAANGTGDSARKTVSATSTGQQAGDEVVVGSVTCEVEDGVCTLKDIS